MWIIVAYDVRTEEAPGRRRLRRVAQVCKDFGQRVQKSVFECQVDEMKFEELKRQLVREIDDSEDNLRFYRLTEPRDQHCEIYGLSRMVFFDEPLIV